MRAGVRNRVWEFFNFALDFRRLKSKVVSYWVMGERVGSISSGRVWGFWVLGWWVYMFITLYIYIFCRAGGYPPDQNSKIRYPYPSVYILTGGRVGERVGRICRAGQNPRVFPHP